MVHLKDEIDFLKAYRYLLEIRYEEKIIFNINIPSQFLDCELPVLTIQPLVENAINHNSCSLSNPLIIDIFINEGNLIVKNNKIKKIRVEKSSGIGLDNLRNRFQLLLNKSITIENTDRIFSVTLPLQQH